MPWELLELDPAVATVKEVKRAYAKRLKTCRPDQDPEGFQKLHQAYTAALAELETQDREAAYSYAIPIVERPKVSEADLRPENVESRTERPLPIPAVAVVSSAGQRMIEESVSQLATALAAENPEDVPARVRAAEAALFEHPAEVKIWGDLMAALIRRYETHEHLRLKPEAMLFEMENDGCEATFAVIERLERLAREEALFSLSRFMLAHRDRIATAAGGLALARLAAAGAIWESSLVPDLADFAYRHLGRGERDFRIHQIEQLRTIGGLLRRVPGEWKLFWASRLLEPAGHYDWRNEVAEEAIRQLLASGRRWECYVMLKDLIPPEFRGPSARPVSPSDYTHSSSSRSGGVHQWEHLKKGGSQRRSGPSSVKTESRRVRRSSQPPIVRQIPRWPVFLLIALVVKVCIFATRCGADSGSSGPSHYEDRRPLAIPPEFPELPRPNIPLEEDRPFHADPPSLKRGGAEPSQNGFPPVGPFSLAPQPVR